MLLAAAVLGLAALSFGLSHWRVRHVLQQQDAQIAKIFGELFPGQPLAADPLALIQSKQQSALDNAPQR